jgi:DNA integrity scanning protein DisA with diadenylate cyclase activity
MTNRILRFSNRVLRRFYEVSQAIASIAGLGQHEQEILLNVLANSKTNTSPELKLKIYWALKMLSKRRRKPFGMIIVFGWQRKWNKDFSSLPDETQNIFVNRRFSINQSSAEKVVDVFFEVSDFDGALLINPQGRVVASGIYLESMRPKKVAEILCPARSQDLSSSFGFVRKVHTRHLAGIAASYWIKGSTVFVVSEEDGSIRIFEGGKIIWSTIRKEIGRI